ncbi:MAG: ABC transporter permease, partial [Alphaproteobacteria bacterium]|nr:ABC transporter permease [Alphaproteobacteria bacterium]
MAVVDGGGVSGGWAARIAHAYRRSEGARGIALLSPTMLIMLAALAAPMALLALYSFWTQDGYVLDTTPTLQQYATSFSRESYRALFYRSLEISSVVTLITVLLAYPMAYFVAFRVEKSKFLWLVLLTIPFWTSYLLRVFAWKLILGYNGVINSGLLSLGLIQQPLEFLLYNPVAVVVTLAHAWAAFAILPIYVSLEKIDRSWLEAAADLGDG